MSELEQWGLRGPVHTCRLQRTWQSQKRNGDACELVEPGDVSEMEFRLDGSIAKHWHQNFDGSQGTTTYERDSAIPDRSGPGFCS